MKLNYLIKAVPFLSTLLILIFISITNQKEYTKLKILIWNTPSLTLSTYLSISTVTGFILSYCANNKFAEIMQSKQKYSLKNKEEYVSDEIPDSLDSSDNSYYDNILIERDIKDPSPTINANFRVIGKRDQRNTNFIDNNNIQYNESLEFTDQPDKFYDRNKDANPSTSNTSDWYDQSFSSW